MDTFKESLQIEKEGQPRADEFYKRVLGATQIKRYDYNDPLQRPFQQADIDCSVEVYAPALDVYWLNFSEKFRTIESGDMCLELWSNFEDEQLGWAAAKRLADGPDAYLYITPTRYYEVWANRFFVDMMDRIVVEWNREKIEKTLKERYPYNKNESLYIPITVCGQRAGLLKSTTHRDGKTWWGICVCIPWETLKNEFNLNMGVYDVNFNKLKL